MGAKSKAFDSFERDCKKRPIVKQKESTTEKHVQSSAVVNCETHLDTDFVPGALLLCGNGTCSMRLFSYAHFPASCRLSCASCRLS